MERQRAFDRRRAKNERLPGSMPREEILFNRHRVKVAVLNEPVKAPPKVFGVAARKSQMRASTTTYPKFTMRNFERQQAEADAAAATREP